MIIVSVDLVKFFGKLVSPMSNLFNKSIRTGVFLEHKKLAMITPVYKGGSELDISNYQPVGISCSNSELSFRKNSTG